MVLVVLGVITASYFWGHWRASHQVAVDFPTPKQPITPLKLVKSVPAFPASSITPRGSGFPPISIDDARELFANALAGKFTAPYKNMAGVRLAILNGLKPADIPDFVKAIADLPDTSDKDVLLNLLIGFFAREAPSDALALIGNMDDPSKFKQAIGNALVTLGKTDPQQALGYLANLSPDSAQTLSLYRDVFAAMVGSNLTSAIAVANGLPAGQIQNFALQGVAAGWVKIDPKAALDWATSIPSNAISGYIPTLLLNAPPALAAQYVNQIQDPSTQNSIIQSIALSWSAGKDPGAALNWLSQVATGDNYNRTVSKIFANLAKTDPATAANVLANVNVPALQNSLIATIASGWGKTDPQAALAWAQTLPDSQSVSALNSVTSSWAINNPAAAAAYVQNSTNPSTFSTADPAIAQALAAEDPQAALTFANSLPDGTAKNQALNNVVVSMAKTDFTAAWSYAATLPAEDNPVGIMTNLVGALANQDPNQAAGLINQFPAGAAQDNAMSFIAKAWISQDPQAFTVWLTGLSPGGVRDAAIAQLASSSQATKDPAAVLNWVNTISNPDIKAALLPKLAPTNSN